MRDLNSKKAMNEDLPLFNDIIHMSDRNEFFLSSSDAIDIGEFIHNNNRNAPGILSQEDESTFEKKELSTSRHSKRSQSIELFSDFNANEDDWLYAPTTDAKVTLNSINSNRKMTFSKENESLSSDGLNSNKFSSNDMFLKQKSMEASTAELPINFLDAHSDYPLLHSFTPTPLPQASNLIHSQSPFSANKYSYSHSAPKPRPQAPSQAHSQYQYKPQHQVQSQYRHKSLSQSQSLSQSPPLSQSKSQSLSLFDSLPQSQSLSLFDSLPQSQSISQFESQSQCNHLSQSKEKEQEHFVSASHLRPQEQSQSPLKTQPQTQAQMQDQLHVWTQAELQTNLHLQSQHQLRDEARVQSQVQAQVQPQLQFQPQTEPMQIDSEVLDHADESVPPNLVTKLDQNKSQWISKRESAPSVSIIDSKKSNSVYSAKGQKSAPSNFTVSSSESLNKKTKVNNPFSTKFSHPGPLLSPPSSSSPSTQIPIKTHSLSSSNSRSTQNATQSFLPPSPSSLPPSPSIPSPVTEDITLTKPQPFNMSTSQSSSLSSSLLPPSPSRSPYPTTSSDLPGLSNDTPPNLRTMNVSLTSPISSKQEQKSNNSSKINSGNSMKMKKGMVTSKSSESFKKSNSQPSSTHKQNSNSFSHSYSHSYSPSPSSYSSFSGNASFLSKPKSYQESSFSSAFNSSTSRTLRFHETKNIQDKYDKYNPLLMQETKSSSSPSLNHTLPSPSPSPPPSQIDSNLPPSSPSIESKKKEDSINPSSPSSSLPETTSKLSNLSNKTVKVVEKSNENENGLRSKKKKKNKFLMEEKNDDVYFEGVSSNSSMSSPEQYSSNSIYQKRSKRNSKRKSKKITERNHSISSEDNSSFNMEGSEQDSEEKRKDSEEGSAMDAEEGALADIESDYSRERSTLKGLKSHNWNRASRVKNETLNEGEREGDEDDSEEEEEDEEEEEEGDEEEEGEEEVLEEKMGIISTSLEKKREERNENEDGKECQGQRKSKEEHLVNDKKDEKNHSLNDSKSGVDSGGSSLAQVESTETKKKSDENENLNSLKSDGMNSISSPSSTIDVPSPSLSSSTTALVPSASEANMPSSSSSSSSSSLSSFSKDEINTESEKLSIKRNDAVNENTPQNYNSESNLIKNELSSTSNGTAMDENNQNDENNENLLSNSKSISRDSIRQADLEQSQMVQMESNKVNESQKENNHLDKGKKEEVSFHLNEKSIIRKSKDSNESSKVWMDEEELYGDLVGQVKAQIEGWKREDSSIDQQSFNKLQKVTLSNGKISFPDVPHTFSENSSNVLSLHSNSHVSKKEAILPSMTDTHPRSTNQKQSEMVSSNASITRHGGYDENASSSSSSSHRLKFSSSLPRSFPSTFSSTSTVHGGHGQENALRKNAHHFNKEMMLLNKMNPMNNGLKSFSSDAFDWDKCSSLDETYSDISTPSTMLSRNMTIEEATEIVLFCSSIVHDLIYKAAIISENKLHITPPITPSSPSSLPSKFPSAVNTVTEMQRNVNSPTLKVKRFDSACSVISEKNESVEGMDDGVMMIENNINMDKRNDLKANEKKVQYPANVPACGCVIL